MSTVPRVPSAVPGQPAELLTVLAHQPGLLQAFFRLYGRAWNGGRVATAQKELARLRCVRTIDCNA